MFLQWQIPMNAGNFIPFIKQKCQEVLYVCIWENENECE